MSPPWGGFTIPTRDVHSPLLPTYGGSPSPTWSHVAHLDLLPGGFLVYKHRRAHQEQFLQPGAAEELLPAPAGRAQAQLQLCDPRTYSASPKKPSKAQTDGQKSQPRPILMDV